MNAVQAFSMSLKLGFPVSFLQSGLAYFSQLAVLVDQPRDLQHAFPVIANLHTPVAYRNGIAASYENDRNHPRRKLLLRVRQRDRQRR